MSRWLDLGVGLSLLVGGALPSCSLLIGGEPAPLRCSREGQVGPPACDAGLTCQGGVCRAVSAVGGADGAGDAASGGEGVGGAADPRPPGP